MRRDQVLGDLCSPHPKLVQGSFWGEIGIAVVLIYRTSPDATEQPAGALPTIEAPLPSPAHRRRNYACGRSRRPRR